MRGARAKQIRRDLLAELRRRLGRAPTRDELPTAGDVRTLKRAWNRRGSPPAGPPVPTRRRRPRVDDREPWTFGRGRP